MKILCCIDNGEAASLALTAAIQLAAKLDATLSLFCVNPVLPGRGAPICLWPEPYVSDLLEAALRKARWAGVARVEQARCRALNIANSILVHADEKEVDYIVLGTRDRTGIARALNGSVSRIVIAKANCPVLAVRRIRERQQVRRGRGLPRRSALRELASAAG